MEALCDCVMTLHNPELLRKKERLGEGAVGASSIFVDRDAITNVYLTVDTELSSMHFRRHGASALEDNFAMSILGRTEAGDVGIIYQMERLDAFGLKGVFFVDPMVALVAGQDMVNRIVHPILDAGHDVQLHAHSEWIELAPPTLTDGRIGRNMGDFSEDDQVRILEYGIERLLAAGAPRPVGFRAGNYGADDNTLRALARVGIRYDTSYSPDYEGGVCRITMEAGSALPVEREGVVEVPVSAISSKSGGSRHAQITALSSQEMIAALAYAALHKHPSFTIVSHSFELLSRQRDRANRIVVKRFDRLCEIVSASPRLHLATYAASPPEPVDGNFIVDRLPHSMARTLVRHGEQAVSNSLYGERLGNLPVGVAGPAIKTGDRLVSLLHNLGPFQQIALDILMGV